MKEFWIVLVPIKWSQGIFSKHKEQELESGVFPRFETPSNSETEKLPKLLDLILLTYLAIYSSFLLKVYLSIGALGRLSLLSI